MTRTTSYAYNEVPVDTDAGHRDYIQITVDKDDDVIDFHAEDDEAGVDLRLTIDEALATIARLTEAVGVALANR